MTNAISLRRRTCFVDHHVADIRAVDESGTSRAIHSSVRQRQSAALAHCDQRIERGLCANVSDALCECGQISANQAFAVLGLQNR